MRYIRNVCPAMDDDGRTKEQLSLRNFNISSPGTGVRIIEFSQTKRISKVSRNSEEQQEMVFEPVTGDKS